MTRPGAVHCEPGLTKAGISGPSGEPAKEEVRMVVQPVNKRRPRRSTSHLAASLDKSLTAYAAAAAAAGVNLLALASPAEAKIVYTHAHKSILFNGPPVLLDLNHDGVTDFSFMNITTESVDSHPRSLLVNGGPSNSIRGRGSWSRRHAVFASALKKGLTIGPNKSYFYGSRGLMANIGAGPYGFYTAGQWFYTSNRYLGLKFMINGHVHYGWARVAVTLTSDGIQATLTGYAYETIPNKPIIAGQTHGADDDEQPPSASITQPAKQPSTLGVLALGAPALSIHPR
jgi:hypothetical protein